MRARSLRVIGVSSPALPVTTYKTMEIPDAPLDQARNTLTTIENCLSEAGFAFSDVARATYYIADAAYAKETGPALREGFGTVLPAATMLVTGLIAPEMKVEIEMTALKACQRPAALALAVPEGWRSCPRRRAARERAFVP